MTIFNPLFNRFKVKYIMLDSLFKRLKYKSDSKIETVNIYINLESILMPLFRDDIEALLESLDKKQLKVHYSSLIANMINVAAHYRGFFLRYKINTNIFYYYNNIEEFGKYNNCAFIPEYREKYYDKFNNPERHIMGELIKEGLVLANTFINYLPDVFFVSSSRIESSCIPLYLMRENKFPCNMNILVSKDMYDLQYINYNTLIIYPWQDNSYIISKNNLFEFLKHKYDMDNSDEMPTLLYPFFLCVLGDKKRNLYKIRGIGFKKLFKEINKLFIKGYIDYNDKTTLRVENLANFIKSDNNGRELDYKEKILTNNQCINLDRQLKIAYKASLLELNENLINNSDDKSLKEINDKFFIETPIELEDLVKIKKKSVFDKLK